MKLKKLYAFLFCRPLFYSFHKKLWALGLRGMGFMNQDGYVVSGELSALNLLEDKKPVIFDVGANIGTWSQMAKRIHPKSTVFAFEPVSITYDKMEGNFNKYRIGLGDYRGEEKIHFKETGKGQINNRIKEYESSEIIVIDTIDHFCFANRIKTIDFLKIDVEGYELKVLRGAQQMIQNKAIKMIQFEFSEENLYNRERLSDFKEILREYTFYRLLSNGLHKIELEDEENKSYHVQNIIAIMREDI